MDEIRNNYLVKDIICTFSERSTKYTSNHSKKCFCVVTVFGKRNERSSGKQLRAVTVYLFTMEPPVLFKDFEGNDLSYCTNGSQYYTKPCTGG